MSITLQRTGAIARITLNRPDTGNAVDLDLCRELHTAVQECAETSAVRAVILDAMGIRVFQDVRGKFASEGEYQVTRPVRGPLNPTSTDHATDAFDTIDWLVHNISESNGRVGVIGSSYEGFTAAMALIEPHPALKAAVPISPMMDGWRGDDWFHNGAFRQTTFDFMAVQVVRKSFGTSLPRVSGVSADETD